MYRNSILKLLVSVQTRTFILSIISVFDNVENTYDVYLLINLIEEIYHSDSENKIKVSSCTARSFINFQLSFILFKFSKF